MKTIALDTNVLLDFMEQRHPRFIEVKQLFEDCVSGKVQIFIPQVVFPEIEWVLRSYYKKPKEVIVELFEELLDVNGLLLEDKPIMQHALSIFKHASIKFTDAIILTQVEKFHPDEFVTFDEDLMKIYQANFQS